MTMPLQITFRNIRHSAAIELEIQEKAVRLMHFCDQITSCRVVIEQGHRHHHKGNLFHVHIDMTVPGEEIVVSREPQAEHAHEDPYVTIRDAFDAARRQLEDYQRIRRGKVKRRGAQGRAADERLIRSTEP